MNESVQKPTVSVVICAAGSGERAGFSRNKLLVPLPQGVPLRLAVKAFDRTDVGEIVVALHPKDEAEICALLADIPKVRYVYGGATRTESVKNALDAVTGETVLVHDGARPFVTQKIIDDCIASVVTYGSGVASLPVTDTTALCDETGYLCGALPRDRLRSLQTPQGFYTAEIRAAYQSIQKGESFTDESSLYLAKIGKPHLFAGSAVNKKLTYREDYPMPAFYTGIGIDTHRFAAPSENAHITLGTVRIPSTSPLVAHSDGDVLIHALMDALLSAAGLADIGTYFPDTDEQYRGIESGKLLSLVMATLRERGFAVGNASCAILAQTPRLAPYIDGMKNSLAPLLGVSPERIGITAGTTEKLGYVGRSEGITVHANVLLFRT